ncbi:hypothetical protein MSAN_00323100 [Mycena sanguinolenta]|uniref:Uncharacterized protein n=1 Tax=Mycena sanguinolenta TaxID=230812 RepID=A0A8H6ZDP3_9AGAR|nr:hypothetical protein MSAN_00323100 [Mycena sanguinolenta]
MIQIGQWYGKHANYNATAKKEPFRPVVKFRNLNEKVLASVQQGQNTSNSEVERLHDLENSDSDEDNETEPGESEQDLAQSAARSSFTFDIDPDINISAPPLLDLVSASPSAGGSTTLAVRNQPPTVPVGKNMQEDIDWNEI